MLVNTAELVPVFALSKRMRRPITLESLAMCMLLHIQALPSIPASYSHNIKGGVYNPDTYTYVLVGKVYEKDTCISYSYAYYECTIGEG